VESAPIDLTFSFVPTIYTINYDGDLNFCKGGTALMHAGIGATYQWYRNDNAITNATLADYAATQSGEYFAMVINNGCEVSTSKLQVQQYPSAFDINESIEPTTHQLFVHYPFQDWNSDDNSGNNNNANFNSVPFDYDRFNQFGCALYFNGSTGYFSVIQQVTNPQEFTLSLWFKTTTTTGGKLIGFGNQATGTGSSTYDRHIYMSNNGKLFFGINNGTPQTISSALSYNDNLWHNVVASFSTTKGMRLYVDGNLVASNSSIVSAQIYNGYWRVGFDKLSGWASVPSSNYFKGFIDDVRIYQRDLASVESRSLYIPISVNMNSDIVTLCSAGSAVFSIDNSQDFVTYQLRKNADNSWVGSPVMGNGGKINFATGVISTNQEFNLLATNTSSSNSCAFQLTKNFKAIVTGTIPNSPISAVLSKNKISNMETEKLSISVTGGSGQLVRWFAGACGINEVGTGNPLTISPPTSTTVYFGRWESCGVSTCVSNTLYVINNPIAPYSISIDRSVFCSNDNGTIKLTANGGSGGILKWYSGSCGSQIVVGTGNPLIINSPTLSVYIYARYENEIGVSSCASINVNPYDAPAKPQKIISDKNNFCYNDNGNITLQIDGGYGWNVHWSVNSCGALTSSSFYTYTIPSPTESTVYYAKYATPNCGYSDCAVLTITVDQSVLVPYNLTSSKTSVTPYEVGNILLTAQNSNTSSRWFTNSCGGNLIGIGYSLTTPSPTVTTQYFVLNQNTCGTSSCVNISVNVIPTLIDEKECDLQILSSNKQLIMTVCEQLIGSNASIYNTTGQLIKIVNLNTGNVYQIDLQQFAAGIYFIKFSNNKYRKVEKFVLGNF